MQNGAAATAQLFRRLSQTERDHLERRWPLYYASPGLMMRELGNVDYFDPWQREILWVSAHHRLTMVVGGTGVGKETIAAWDMIHATLTRPFSKVWATSASKDQLTVALWQEIATWIDHSPILGKMLEWRETRVVVRGYEERWRMFMKVAAVRTAGSSKEAEGGAGTHHDHMFCVLTEASGIPDPVANAALLTMTKPDNRILALMNPLRCEGWAYDAATQARQRAKSIGGPGWYVRHVQHADSSFVDPAVTRDLIARYGERHPLVRTKVFAEFVAGLGGMTAFTEELVEQMFQRFKAPDEPHLALQIGCDPAREGDDETTIYTRRGARILQAEAYAMTTGPECVQLCVAAAFRWWRRPHDSPRPDGWVPTEAELRELKQSAVFVVDDVGVGGMGVVDWLRNFGWRVVGVNNGAAARDQRHYANIVTEMYCGDANEWAGRGYVKEDDVLRRQLTRRKVFYTGKREQRQLESKKDAKKVLGDSPDRADGFVLAVCRARVAGTADFRRVVS